MDGDWTYLADHEAFNKTFDVALHLGTLIAVVAYFWWDIGRYIVALVSLIAATAHRDRRRAHRLGRRRGDDPGRPRGALGESFIEKKLGEPWQIAIMLAVFGVCSGSSTGSRRSGIDDVGVRNGFLIGLAQCSR